MHRIWNVMLAAVALSSCSGESGDKRWTEDEITDIADDAATDTTELEGRLDDLESQLSDQESTIQSQADEIEILKSTVSDLEGDLAARGY